MDIIFLGIGAVLFFIGSRQKDEAGMPTSSGKAIRTIGIVLFAIGAIIFVMGFIVGFAM